MKTVKTSLFHAILAALALCTMARAEAPKEAPAAKTEATQAAAPKQEQIKGVYTPESIRAMLDNMGYEYKTYKFSNGSDYYVITVNQDGLTVPLQVECSPDGTEIWFTANVGDFAESTASEALLTMLEKNGSATGKAMFAKRGKMIVLLQPVDDHDLTPARFRKEVETFCTVVKVMQPIYAAAQKTTVVAKAPAQGADARQESK